MNWQEEWSKNSDMASGIYLITNISNGHRYVGSAVELQKRWTTHLWSLRRGRHHSRYLQRAFRKYGESAFTFEVLEEWEPKFLVGMEQWWLNMLRPEYNINCVAGSQLGAHHTVEERQRQSTRQRGKRLNLSQEARQAKVERMIGNKLSLGRKHTREALARMSVVQTELANRPETRAKRSEAMLGNNYFLGHKHTEETRAKMSKAVREANLKPEVRARRRRKHPWQSTRMQGNQYARGKHWTLSPETKAKMAEARRLWWARKQGEP